MTRSMLPAEPLWNVLDDEEVLARLDIAERPRLAREDCERRRPPQASLERRLLLLQVPHGHEPVRTLRPRAEVVVQRPVVEKPDEHERSDREPAARAGSAETPAAGLSRGHPAGVLRPRPRSSGVPGEELRPGDGSRSLRLRDPG